MNKILKIKFLIIIILGINSCTSNKKETTSKEHIPITLKTKPQNVDIEKSNEFVKVYFNLPFESSNGELSSNGKYDNFKLLNNQNKIITPESDTATKTGGHIDYLLKRGNYRYSMRTPFNETISKEIEVQKDIRFSHYSYNDCYQLVDKFSENDLKNSKKINVYTTYEDDDKIDEIQIDKENKYYILKIKKGDNWSKKKYKKQF